MSGKDITKQSNYDFMRDKMQREFLKYDIDPIIKKYQMQQDEDFYYIRFIGRECRISKTTGKVEKRYPTGEWIAADYNESMTIYDVLCYAKPDAEIIEEYEASTLVRKNLQSTSLGGDFFKSYAMQLTGKTNELKKACEQLGGIRYPVGEVSYQIKIFDFIPVLFQFWDADEEFDAQMFIKWNKNIHDFMHYETTFFAACVLLKRLIELTNKQ